MNQKYNSNYVSQQQYMSQKYNVDDDAPIDKKSTGNTENLQDDIFHSSNHINNYDSGNAIQIILSRLQSLRIERENVNSEIESLELEKVSICSTLPKIVFQIQQLRELLDLKYHDIDIYTKAIEEIEEVYSDVISTADLLRK